MGHERIDLHEVVGLRRHRRWRTGRLNTSTEQYAELGELPDGRFYARHTGKGAAFVYSDERFACEKIEQWLSRGEWHPIPACFDARGQPADGLSWMAHGQTWVPANQSGSTPAM